MPVAVLERFGHLRSDHQQDGRERDQPHRGPDRSHESESSVAQAAKGQHLEEFDRAEAGYNDKPEGEDGGVHREHRLPPGDREWHDGEGPETQDSLQRNAGVTGPHVCLIAPLLASLNDAVLRRADEDAATPGGADHGDHGVQRHPGAHDLAQQ